MSHIEFHTAGEWTAVYLDGHLVEVGDSYHADEWLRTHFGVIDIQDDAFLLGQNRYDGVAKTVDEITAFRDERQARRDRAEMLRAEAQKLEDEAKAPEAGGSER